MGKLEVTVIGAGIGGLTAALSLHEIGAHVELFEAAPSLEPIGVGINLLPHAVRELDALGLLDRLTERAVLPETLIYCTRRGQEIWSEPRGRAAQYRWPQVSTHRGVLQEVLLDAFLERVGERHLHLNRTLSNIEEAGDRPAARFGDEVAEADLIVAADGIHSVARRQRYPDEGPPLWNGSLMWRGLAEVERVLDGRTMIWAGHPDQKFVGYPIADGADGRQTFNFIAELRRPGSGLAADEDWNRTGRFEDFLPQFLDWNFGWLDVPAIITAAPETYLYPMVDREPLPRWSFGGTTLLGDAAHPMYPIGSNGASQAILDARVLAGCLRRHPSEIGVALARYEDARRPATAAIVAANRGMGPERPMALVEERAPGGFERIDDVISKAEIEAVTEGYRRTAGFAVSDLARGASLLDEPYRA